ncbi:MAG: hypothetical protein KDA91_08305 [Planctomycetaceae bacterium]|nr:hypothetical protein [Planctomycetaceae bacterium]
MYRTLDTDQTIATLQTLSRRIEERFPDSGLGKVCQEICRLASETRGRIEWMSKPHGLVRLGIALLIFLVVAACWGMFHYVKANKTTFDVTEFVPMLEAGLNALVLVGAALFFLLTLESRIKRARALKSLHELRSVAHVIDMHQLTKDPSQLLATPGMRTASSPKRNMTAFQLTRYLDYCSEMLSLLGKIASLYAQSTPDSVILQAVNDIETLTNGLSRNIWQKIMILDDDVQRDQALSAAKNPQAVHMDQSAGSPVALPESEKEKA